MTSDLERTRFDARTRVLLEGPILRTLLRLATPNVLVMLVQASVGLVETYFVGKLGTDALAGVTLVFPVLMLMQMMSAGAMGGGISSAVARALGAGRRADADALAFHALVIGLVFGLGFTLAVLGGGPWLYAAMGGRGASLAAGRLDVRLANLRALNGRQAELFVQAVRRRENNPRTTKET